MVCCSVSVKQCICLLCPYDMSITHHICAGGVFTESSDGGMRNSIMNCTCMYACVCEML